MCEIFKLKLKNVGYFYKIVILQIFITIALKSFHYSQIFIYLLLIMSNVCIIRVVYSGRVVDRLYTGGTYHQSDLIQE